MATNTERLDNLDEVVNYLQTQEKLFTQRIDRDEVELRALRDEVTKLRDEYQKLQTLASVLRTEVDDLKKSRETWTQRWWHLAAGALLAVLGGVIGYLIKR